MSLLRNQSLFEIYNGMDVPELMRRVLEVAPPSIREVFDDHKGLTDALRSGDAECHGRGHHRARQPGAVRLAAFVAEQEAQEAARAARGGRHGQAEAKRRSKPEGG